MATCERWGRCAWPLDPRPQQAARLKFCSAVWWAPAEVHGGRRGASAARLCQPCTGLRRVAQGGAAVRVLARIAGRVRRAGPGQLPRVLHGVALRRVAPVLRRARQSAWRRLGARGVPPRRWLLGRGALATHWRRAWRFDFLRGACLRLLCACGPAWRFDFDAALPGAAMSLLLRCYVR